MKKILTPVNRVEVSVRPIDWEAYELLQKKLSRTRSSFKIEALDYALEKTLQSPDRTAKGLQLAKDLYRDGKKHAIAYFKTSGKKNKARIFYSELYDYADEIIAPNDTIPESIHIAVNSFKLLSERERTALYLRATSQDDESAVGELLGIGSRQFRNLIKGACAKLNTVTGFYDACQVLQFIPACEKETHNILAILKHLLNTAATAA